MLHLQKSGVVLERGEAHEPYKTKDRGVAQPGSALASGARGPEFESPRPDQVFTYLLVDHMNQGREFQPCYFDPKSTVSVLCQYGARVFALFAPFFLYPLT